MTKPVRSTIQHDATTRMVMRLGTALIRAVDEHGAPNSFSFAELVGARDAMFAGRAVRRHWWSFCLNVDARRPGTRVELTHGRLHVEHVGS